MKTDVLYYGDNLEILRKYIPDASVDLIYLDPPFNSNRDYNVIFKDESGRKSDAQIVAFDDTWHWGPGPEAHYDALSVARAALREPNLPSAQLDGVERELRLLVDHREDLIADRTRHQARLRWFLVELGIAEPKARTLGRTKVLGELERHLADRPEFSARISRDLLARIRELTGTIDNLEGEIRARTEAIAPTLLALPGCGHLSAAKLVGETSGIGRFRSRAAFAAHNGTAPIPVWSGNVVRHRLNIGGNRQLNAALHRIAITQLRGHGGGREYVARRMAAGDTKLEAIRALRRRISDEVYRRLGADEAARATLSSAVKTAA